MKEETESLGTNCQIFEFNNLKILNSCASLDEEEILNLVSRVQHDDSFLSDDG